MGSLSGLCKRPPACPRAVCGLGARRVGSKPPGKTLGRCLLTARAPCPGFGVVAADPSEGPGAPPAVPRAVAALLLRPVSVDGSQHLPRPGSAQGAAGTSVATPAPRGLSGTTHHSSRVCFSLCSRLAGGSRTDLWASRFHPKAGPPRRTAVVLGSTARPRALSQGWGLPRALVSRSCIHGGDAAQEKSKKTRAVTVRCQGKPLPPALQGHGGAQ